MDKPSIDEVLAYAKPNIRKFIVELAYELPQEQQEEIEQNAYLRIVEAYVRLEAAGGWKSFVYNHCRGAVLDYLKFGHGFKEGNWRLSRPAEPGQKFREKLRARVQLIDSEGEDVDAEFVAGLNGVFTELQDDPVRIKWELVARMAHSDPALHCLAKWIRGFQVSEIASVLGLCRARVGQLLQIAVNRFDNPEEADEVWFKQMCYALGICRRLGLPDVDQSQVLGFSVGWSEPMVDLDAMPIDDDIQMSLFDDVG